MADWQAARERAGELTRDGEPGRRAYEARLAANPEIAYSIVRDVYAAVVAEEERARGLRRTGRRPAPPMVPLAQVWSKVTPTQFSMDPFPEALEKLMNGRSQRQFARKVPCHQTTLSRLLTGQLQPDLSMMERIAEAAGVGPQYFVEYRARFVAQAIEQTLVAHPNRSVTAWQVLSGTRSPT